MTKPRPYYSHRILGSRLDLATLSRLVLDVYQDLTRQDYFQEAFGYSCVDEGEVPGTAGADVIRYVARRMRREGLWPIEERCRGYSEHDLFDVIEFLHDHVSKPLDGRFHSYSNCGWHYQEFDRGEGQRRFRDEINALLGDYRTGYELSCEGEILSKAPIGFMPLHEGLDGLQFYPSHVDPRIRAAERKFRRYGASLDDRRDAVRSLADVMERLRPQMKTLLTRKDEADLFEIVNRFGIRHHDLSQKVDYDQEVWLRWMFYHYMATIQAVLWFIRKQEESRRSAIQQ